MARSLLVTFFQLCRCYNGAVFLPKNKKFSFLLIIDFKKPVRHIFIFLIGLGLKINTPDDIVDVERIRKILESEHGERFAERTFTANEQDYCRKFKNPYPRFAGRFAVKEAFIKAASSIAAGLSLKEVETLNAHSGAPSISVLSSLFDRERFQVNVSISHTDDMAVAFVAIENKEE